MMMFLTTTGTFDLDEYVMHHIQDSNEWKLPFSPPFELPIFLTLHGLMMIICSAFLIILFCVLYRKGDGVPTGITNFLEFFVLFIRDDIAVMTLGKELGRQMTPFLCTMFFFILGLNLLGLIPLFATATANISVTAGLALVTLTFMTVGAIFKNGWRAFFKALIPSGVPFPILFLLVPIELLGLFIKTFALMIRLFANMFAGHIVILSILGIVIIIGYIASFPVIIMALFISLLEILVAFLQAYIFTFLSALFIGLIYHPEH